MKKKQDTLARAVNENYWTYGENCWKTSTIVGELTKSKPILAPKVIETYEFKGADMTDFFKQYIESGMMPVENRNDEKEAMISVHQDRCFISCIRPARRISSEVCIRKIPVTASPLTVLPSICWSLPIKVIRLRTRTMRDWITIGKSKAILISRRLSDQKPRLLALGMTIWVT